ncbi:MAG: xylulokinase [Proteobacteria bacterium]|nr:xylulokinase [Pseudomonadota bacterium]
MITLGIDCGTQSLKTVALDGDSGKVIASASTAYGLVEGLPAGHLEQDPAIWWDALEETLQKVLADLGPRKAELAGIGVSGQQHGFVPLDASHQVVRAAKLWCDTSTTAQCDEIRAKLGGREKTIALAGNDILPGFTAPKILWLKQNEPANFAKLAHVALPHDFLNLRLTGTLRMEFGDASGTALLDVRTRQWSKQVCAAIDDDLITKLPPVGSSTEPVGKLLPALASSWGLSPDVIISAGGGDNMMAAIGTGNICPGTVTASLGTSGTIFACAPQPVIDPQGEIAAFCDSADHWMPLLCTMNVTVATEAFRNLFGWDHDRMDREISSVPSGAEALIFLPYLQGERTPNLPEGCGVLHGMNTSNLTPAHMARAVMEGVTLGMGYGLRRMESLALKPSEIRLTGGGSKSPAWRQMLADIFGYPVVTMQSAEGAALGAAIQALAAATPNESLEKLSDRCAPIAQGSRLEPRKTFDYARLLETQNHLRQKNFAS